MSGGEALTHLHVMKAWAQQVSEEFREEAIKTWQSKFKANKKPATVTPKWKRKEVADDMRDGAEYQEEKEISGGESESERDDSLRRPTRGRKTHSVTVVTLPVRARQTGDKPLLVGAALKAIAKEQ